MPRPAATGEASENGAYNVSLQALPFALPAREELLASLTSFRSDLRALDERMTSLAQIVLDSKNTDPEALGEYRALEATRPHLWYRVRLLDAALWLQAREGGAS